MAYLNHPKLSHQLRSSAADSSSCSKGSFCKRFWWANLLSATHWSTHHTHWVMFDSHLGKFRRWESSLSLLKYLDWNLCGRTNSTDSPGPGTEYISSTTTGPRRKCASFATTILKCRVHHSAQARNEGLRFTPTRRVTTLYQKLCFKTRRCGEPSYGCVR